MIPQQRKNPFQNIPLNYKKDKDIYKALALLTQIGAIMSAAILLMTLLGYWLEKKFHSHGVLLVICVILGVISGFVTNYKIIVQFLEKKKEEK